MERFLYLLAIWMHLHGHTASQYVDLRGSLGSRFQGSDFTVDRFTRWIRFWRGQGLAEPFHSYPLEFVWQAAAAVCLWNGLDDLDVEGLPEGLRQWWTNAQRVASCTTDYDDVASRVAEGDPKLADRVQGDVSANRLGDQFEHLHGARCLRSIADQSDADEREALYRRLARDLLAIEIACLVGDDDSDRALSTAAANARRVVRVPILGRGAWAEPGDRVPDHLRERFVTGGHRLFRYATGDMVCVCLYPEDQDALKRLLRFCREPFALGIDKSDTIRPVLNLVLPLHVKDRSPLYAPLGFRLDSIDDRSEFIRVLTQRGMRLEVYADVGVEIRCVDTGFVPVPEDAVEKLREMLTPWSDKLCDPDEHHQELLKDAMDDRPARLDASEMSRFEHLWDLSLHAGRGHMTQDERDALRASIRSYLSKANSLVPDPEGLELARVELMTALRPRSPAPRPRAGTLLAQGVLGDAARWILYADIREGALDLVAGGLGETGEATFERVEVPIDTDFLTRLVDHEDVMYWSAASWVEKNRSLGELAAWWDGATAAFAQGLQRRGVKDILLCPGHALETLPMHIAPSWAERFTLAYVPSLALTQLPLEDLLPRGVDLHEGEAASAPLAQLEHEMLAVKGAHRPVEDHGDFLRPRHRFVHYAGHGRGRAEIRSRALRTSRGEVTIADILASGDYAGVQTVTLSACSTGAFLHYSGAPLALGGIDYALIAVGARSTVSTMWDVHDTATAVFMSVLHSCLAEAMALAESFNTARDVLRVGAHEVLDRLDEPLRRAWPTWRQDLQRDDVIGHAVHWGAFRLGGRYW